MLIKLLKQVFKPVYLFLNNPDYRTWCRLHSLSSNKQVLSLQIYNHKFYTNNLSSFLNQFEQIFIQKIYDFQSQNCKVIVDAGANFGLSVLYFHLNYPDSEIHAFEPDPVLFELLNRNVKTWANPKIFIYNQAVYKQNGFMGFNTDPAQGGHLSLNNDKKVETIRFSNFLDQFSFIDFLKIDIEGAEFEVIPDIEKNLVYTQNLFVEFHHQKGSYSDFLSILSLLNKLNFTVACQTDVLNSSSNKYKHHLNINTEVFASKS